MQIQIGDKILVKSEYRSKNLVCQVVDISKVEDSTYFRVVTDCYDHWVHISNVIKRLAAPTTFLFDDSNTVIRHLDDLYK